MQLLICSALLLLIPSTYGESYNTYLSTNLPINPFTRSAIIAFPDNCTFSGKSATIQVFDANGANIQSPTFTVPQCRLKRDLIVVQNLQNGNIQSVNVGYQVLGLLPNKKYTVQYVIPGATFNNLTFTTLPDNQSPPIVFSRSGGMVVITVLLCIAMFLLVVGLIAVLVLGGRGAK